MLCMDPRQWHTASGVREFSMRMFSMFQRLSPWFCLFLCLTAACQNSKSTKPRPVCGDGHRDDGEACDGEDLGAQTCADIPGFAAGTLTCSADCRLDVSACEAAVSPSDRLLSGETLARVDIALSDFAVDSLSGQSNVYVPGDVRVELDGQTYELPQTGVRLKGKWGSFRTLDQKAAFLLKFNEFVSGQRFFGLKKLAVNNMVQDPSFVHEHIGYKLFRHLGLPAPRTGWARVFVNGELFGLYVLVESTDNPEFLDRWFGGHEGSLYEGEYGVDLFSGSEYAFDQDNGADSTRADLQDFIAFLEQLQNFETFMDDIASRVDMQRYLHFAATEIYMGHWDGYAWTRNNYFIHHGGADGRWTWIPWGIDQTFAADLGPFGGDGRLQMMCRQSLACRQALVSAFEDVFAAVRELDLLAEIDRLTVLLRDAALEDPRRECSENDIAGALTGTRSFIRNREAQLRAQFVCVDPAALDADGDGSSGCGEDCDDGDPDVHPGAPERCNLRDDDCNGVVDDSPECPHCVEQTSPDGQNFAFCFVALPFGMAESDCVSMGGHLASIHDAATQDFVVAAAFGIAGGEWWIGGTDEGFEGHFMWTDRTPFDAAFWNEGEPNNAGGSENCVHLASWAAGRWNDIPCETQMNYVCRLP